MCTAAVGHRTIRGNGSMLEMRSLAQQLENATRDSYPTTLTSRAARITTATTNPSQLAAPHCLSRVRSLLRLREAAERPGRQRRLRAYFTTRSWMPIPRPVNSLGTQSSRNTMIYEIDRSDGQRAFLRRAARVVRKKVASLCPEGTRHRCPLGSITSFAPREAVDSPSATTAHSCLSITCTGPTPQQKNQTKHSLAIWNGWREDLRTRCLPDGR